MERVDHILESVLVDLRWTATELRRHNASYHHTTHPSNLEALERRILKLEELLALFGRELSHIHLSGDMPRQHTPECRHNRHPEDDSGLSRQAARP